MQKSLSLIAAMMFACGAASAMPQDSKPNYQDKPNQDKPNRPATKHDDSKIKDHDRQARADRAVSFASGDKLRGMTVENSTGENVGELKDFIIDRGSGTVAYAVMKSGQVLGMGGKDTVVPFTSLAWNIDGSKATLNVMGDEVKNWPEFDLEAWSKTDRNESSLPRMLATRYYRGRDGITVTYDNAQTPEHVRGTVTQINRAAEKEAPEFVTILVTDGNRKPYEVVVGPSWYLSGNSVHLYRGADVDLETVRVVRSGDNVLYARSITLDSRAVPLYTDSGWPTWTPGAAVGTGTTLSFIDTPFVLSTEIDGKMAAARGEKCGSVDDLIIETGSGRIAFLSIDTDENPAGMADAEVLTPWSVVSAIGKDMVMLDATKEMIISAQHTPDDVRTLTTDGLYRSIYRTYDVQTPKWDHESKGEQKRK